MLITVASARPADEVANRLPKACADHGFGVLGIHDLRAKLREKGQTYDRACMVFEVCRPDIAREALDRAPEVSSALPCRISLYEGLDGRTWLATIRPRELLALVGPPGLDPAADLVERELRAIMAAAAG